MGLYSDWQVFAVAPVRYRQNTEYSDEASGFFYWENSLFFITNRHVLIDEKENHFPDEIRLLLHTNDGKNSQLVLPLYENGEQLWLEHPSNGTEIDVVALPITPNTSRFHIIPFRRQNMIGDIDLLLGEDVLVLGYPLGFRDTLNNYPVARKATIASLYGIQFEGRNGFLVDARLHRGTSGSPVITKEKYTIRSRNGDIRTKYSQGPPPRYLLGVHSEYMEPVDRDAERDEPLGLNFVWYASLIPEICLTRAVI